MVESGQGVGLAAAELGDQRHDRRGILGSPRQSAQDHAHVLAQGAGEAGAGKELRRVAVVVRTFVRSHLLQRDGKFVGIEGAPFADFGAGSVFLYQGSIN